jgi:hypothetical protein
MREVILPEYARYLAEDHGTNAPNVTYQQFWDKRMAESRALAANCLAGLTSYQVLTIRREVALRLPDKPMTKEETQVWLDENTAGVAHYMKTGRVYGL